MSSGEPRLERLRPEHDVAGFASGVDELDDWLRRHALAAQAMDSARTFVVVRGIRVVGYVSLTMGSVRRADAPARLVRGMPAYPVGMVLIARLAIDRADQGTGLVTRLLADGLRMAVLAGEAVAARLVAVDAIDERAAQFIEPADSLSRSTILCASTDGSRTSEPSCSTRRPTRCDGHDYTSAWTAAHHVKCIHTRGTLRSW